MRTETIPQISLMPPPQRGDADTNACLREALTGNSGSDEPGASGRIVELDAMRGLAVLLVVSKHYDLILPGGAESTLVTFLNRSWSLVSATDFLFVLIGFFLGGQLIDTRTSGRYYRTFYVRRACRVLPLYYVTLLIFIVAVIIQDAMGMTRVWSLLWPFDTPWSMIAYACFLQNLWMVHAGSHGPRWLEVTWALAVVEQFYIVLPWLLQKVPRRALVYLIGGLFCSAPICRMALLHVFTESNPLFLDHLPICRTDTLAAGLLAALICRSVAWRPMLTRYRRWLCPCTVIAVGGFGLLCYSKASASPIFIYGVRYSYLSVIYLFAMFTAVFASDGVIGSMLRLKLLSALGRVSYGMFLLHQPVNGVIHGISFGVPPRSFSLGAEEVLEAATAFLLTATLAAVSWRFLEKPIIKWGRSIAY
jgi:peptidoglycan/LPS O-acetylase OafA/YrhL